MNIDQIKCDQCGKVHDNANRWRSSSNLLTVLLNVNGTPRHLDFCNEDCLRDHLNKRAETRDGVAITLSPSGSGSGTITPGGAEARDGAGGDSKPNTTL